jgi:hypothetical protein
MSHYLKEFPDYDAELPTLDGFVDDSWHNDTCPSLFNATYNLKLWCEYENPELRVGTKRFILYYQDIEESLNDRLILESDNLDDIKKAIEKATL